jgi:hypothetical protein
LINDWCNSGTRINISLIDIKSPYCENSESSEYSEYSI